MRLLVPVNLLLAITDFNALLPTASNQAALLSLAAILLAVALVLVLGAGLVVGVGIRTSGRRIAKDDNSRTLTSNLDKNNY